MSEYAHTDEDFVAGFGLFLLLLLATRAHGMYAIHGQPPINLLRLFGSPISGVLISLGVIIEKLLCAPENAGIRLDRQLHEAINNKVSTNI